MRYLFALMFVIVIVCDFIKEKRNDKQRKD